MQVHIAPIQQQIVNKINGKQDFTYCRGRVKRYVVGVQNLHTSFNPSMKFLDSLTVIYSTHKTLEPTETIGGWKNPETGQYHVDRGISFDHIRTAMTLARINKQICIWDTVEKVIIATCSH